MLNKIICGDCLEVMKGVEDNTIDTVITDPPYHLTSITKRFGKKNSAPAKYGTDGIFQRSSKGFMGQTWDGGDIAFKTEIWEECLRVAKPGATLLCFGGSRTYHRMACAVEDAGWVIKDCIMWVYGSGFPKALDISKQVDKRAGAEREVIGKKTGKTDFSKVKEGSQSFYESAWNDKDYIDLDITSPTTEEAKQWDGWKSHGLKPAYEPIIVAMKPNDGAYVDNALKWGVSGFNIDECRVEHNEDLSVERDGHKLDTNKQGWGFKAVDRGNEGRFPANIIFDEEAGKLLDEQKKGASRFFYCAKANKKEKGANNSHACVKPLKLMEYLCKLTSTPTGGIVLDPFAGSGSTLVAAKNVGRSFIGIEMNKEYCEIAEGRIDK